MALRVTDEDFRVFLARTGAASRLTTPIVIPKESKYKNKWTEVDGLKFQSKGEANRWCELRTMERAGVISGLARQVPIPIEVDGDFICDYRADFVYYEQGVRIVEDFKGMVTELYALKKRLLYVTQGIEIREVHRRR